MDSLQTDVDLIGGIPAVPTILDVVCRTTSMGFAAVARVTEKRWVACSVLDNIHFGLKAGGELELETTICHEIRQVQKPVTIDHVALDETYRDHHTPRHYGFQSYISVPIFLADGQFFGTLCAIDPKPASVSTPAVLGMFQLFAELIAFHIDASEKVARSESLLKAERSTSELREQFIGVLGHDLRSPLGAISMGAMLLRDSPLNEEQTTTLDMLDRSVTRMSELINDTMDFTRGRLGGGITVESQSDLPIELVLNQVIEETRVTWPSRVIDTRFDFHGIVHFDRKRITQLFTNLLTNAMVHGRPGTPVVVSTRGLHGKLELSVSNAADPIPLAVQKRLFEPFKRGDAGNYQQGLGLGLYIASEIARSHGGTLGVISTEKETRFTFTMPVE